MDRISLAKKTRSIVNKYGSGMAFSTIIFFRIFRGERLWNTFAWENEFGMETWTFLLNRFLVRQGYPQPLGFCPQRHDMEDLFLRFSRVLDTFRQGVISWRSIGRTIRDLEIMKRVNDHIIAWLCMARSWNHNCNFLLVPATWPSKLISFSISL